MNHHSEKSAPPPGDSGDSPRPLRFFLNFEPNPPTVTHQEKKVRVVHGKPVFYMPPELKDARLLLAAKLKPFAPPSPWSCPTTLLVRWIFSAPGGRGRKPPSPCWKITKPDTDNLQKMLKDVMTDVGFWRDDAFVCRECVEKVSVPADEKHGIVIKIIPCEPVEV